MSDAREKAAAARFAQAQAAIRKHELAREVIEAAKAWRYEGGSVATKRLREAVERLGVAEVNHDKATRAVDEAAEAAGEAAPIGVAWWQS